MWELGEEMVLAPGLGSLEWVSLDKNLITTVSHLSFLPLANVNGLNIHQNPWNCTCQLKPFMKVGGVTRFYRLVGIILFLGKVFIKYSRIMDYFDIKTDLLEFFLFDFQLK